MPEKRLIIHIGTHKTGTTSIQRSLYNHAAENVSFLRDIPGYKTFRGNGSHLFKALLTPNELKKYLNKFNHEENNLIPGGSSTVSDLLLEFFKNNKEKTSILSGEWLSTDQGSKVLKSIIQLAEPYFTEIQVVAYLRNPTDWAASMWKQNLKNIRANQLIEKHKIQSKRFEFIEHLKTYESSIDFVHINLLSFEKALHDKGCIVQAFFEEFDISYDQNKIERRNDSLSLEATSLLLLIKELCQKGILDASSSNLKYLKQKLIKLTGRKYHFSNSILTSLTSEIEDDLNYQEFIKITGRKKLEHIKTPIDSVEISLTSDFSKFRKESINSFKKQIAFTELGLKKVLRFIEKSII